MNKPNPTLQLKQLRKEINSILDKGITQFLQPWANTKTPMYIYIQGYTPSFNDGDPCTHGSHEYDKDEIISDGTYEYNEDFFGNITKEDLLASAEWPKEREFRDAIEGVHEALEYKYGTDYHVLITLKDSQVSYVRDHYDCGY